MSSNPFLLSLLLLLFSLNVWSQPLSQKLDSLERLEATLPDAQKLEVMMRLAEGYMSLDMEKAKQYAREGLKLAYRFDAPLFQVQAFDLLGKQSFRVGNYELAGEYFESGLQAAEAMGNPMAISVLCNSLGILSKKQEEYEKALGHYRKALRIYEKAGDKAKGPRLTVMTNIGGLYSKLEQYEKAIEILEEAMYLAEEYKLERKKGVLSSNLGIAYQGKGDYATALLHFQEALAVKRQSPDPIDLLPGLANIFSLYVAMGEEANAELVYEEAWSIAKARENKPWHQDLLNRYGDFQQQNGHLDKAKELFVQSLDIARELEDRTGTLNLLLKLRDLSAEQGDLQQAYEYLKEYESLKESQHREDLEQRINGLEERFALQKQLEDTSRELEQAQLQGQMQRNQLYWMLVAIFLSVMSLLALLSRFQIKQKSHKALRQSNESIKQQNQLLALKNDEIQTKNDLLEEQSESIKRQNLLLQQSNADLEQFAYAASHDLREPLRTIRSYMQLLERRYEDLIDENGKEFIRFATDGASRMDTLLKDLLEYSRIGRKGIQMQSLDTNEIVNKVLLNLNRQIDDTAAEVRVESLPRIRGFESEITLLFQNLISNALKFHRQGAKPVVKVEGQSFPDYHVFSVSDNGIGIPAEFQESVFALFQRFHSRWDYEGTGMGLAICKKIVSNHQGEIWLDSRENGGATFFFKIPKL